MNVIYLIGNVGRDPEGRNTQGGTAMVRFSIATTQRWKDKDGERQEKTTWHNCVAWGAVCDVVEKYVAKGSKIAVIGRLEKRKYTSREGDQREAVEVIVERLELLGSKDHGRGRDRDEEEADEDEDERPRHYAAGHKRAAAVGNGHGQRKPERRSEREPIDLDDDIPF